MLPAEIAAFLDTTITGRISLRLIAEQHIAISRTLREPDLARHHIGIVDMQCSPADMIKMCSSYVSELCEGTLGAAPQITLDGEVETTFA